MEAGRVAQRQPDRGAPVPPEEGYPGVEAALAKLTSGPAAGSEPDLTPEGLAAGLLAACERHGAGQMQSDGRTVLILARHGIPGRG